MKIFRIALLSLVIGISCQISIAQIGKGASVKTHYYSVEYMKPVIKGGSDMLWISLFVKTTPGTAESIARDELNRVLKYFPPTNGIGVYASYFPSDDNEIRIKFSDGSAYLSYDPKTKKVIGKK